MVLRYFVVVFCVVNFEPVKRTDAQQINGDILADELNKVTDALGVSFIQEEYNKLKYNDIVTDGEAESRYIAKKIGERMEKMEEALTKLKQEMEKQYEMMTPSSTYQDCCSSRDYPHNLHFRTNVSTDMFCYSKPSYVQDTNIKYPTSDVLNTMKSNHRENKNIQFQYVALKSGLYINYPATNLIGCDTYDPRFRPYFVSSTTSTPRDVVLVLQMSASMRGDKLNEAKHAAITVLESLSVNDKIGIVVFNNKAQSPSGCYGDKLVPVTRTTKQHLKDFINAEDATEGPNYAEGLRKAFTYFRYNSSEEGFRDQIMLFVSDGDNNAGDNPLEVIRDENHRLQNRVVINTYGIGTGLNTNDRQLLENMAKQTLNNNTYGYIKVGKSVIIADVKTSYLREAMGTFYDYSSIPISLTPTFTQAYKDFFTKEFVITGCLPAAYQGSFIGVVCADILLSELVSETLYLQQGENSYVFIIDGNERALIHPLLPDPRDVNASDYDINDIYNFETAGDVPDVINSMKKGMSGNKTLVTTVTEPRGDRLLDGDLQRILNAVYYWTPIVAPGSNFSLCLVMEKNNTITVLRDVPRHGAHDFVYHRWDLTTWPALSNCRHFNRFATKATTTVKLSPEAFINPYEYQSVEETERKVQQYTDYISGDISTNPGIKASAVNSIRATAPIEGFWKTYSSRDAPYLVWRYIMTEDGVERIFPGVRLTDDYDHKLRPWYRRTVALKKMNVVSAPYEDSWGSGKVITVSRSILKKATTQGGSDKIEAVMGTDFSIYYFNQILKDKYPICANTTTHSCIVIDNSGFLVMHPFYIETTDLIDSSIHLTYKEGRISRSLIKEGIMYRQPCRDTENKKEQFTYRVKLPQNHLNGIVNSEEGYEMRPVTGSNLFLILKQRKTSQDLPCCSEKSSVPPSSLKCGDDDCTCLCYKNQDFNDCENKYTMDGISPCNPKLPTLSSVSTPEGDKNKYLSTCFPTDCPCRKTESECFRTSGCSWCTSTMSGSKVGKYYCDLKESCPSKQCVTQSCTSKCCGSECGTVSSQSNVGEIAAGVTGGTLVVVLVIIGIIVFVVYKRRRQDQDDTYLDPTHDIGKKEPSRDSEHYVYPTDYHMTNLGATTEEGQSNGYLEATLDAATNEPSSHSFQYDYPRVNT
ncbi:VWFA and cache domain-containing protein 1-like [Ostrea edulis]|uniref:VWFA and cache domain-containing protein 1-like n=1 Tax=Ostrea edulis TaxID=37623 RepID=UPI0024AF0A0D|nr:VWFA and cache domain-containing protein 1-like [Ostrea edulis]